MRKKILLALVLLIPFISIILIIGLRVVIEPTNEEIIEKLRGKAYYSSNVEYIIKNSRGEQREELTLYFSKDHGGRIDFGEDRIKFYSNESINIKDNISDREYTMDKEMDKVHSIAFMENLIAIEDVSGIELKEGQEEWGETQYIEFIMDLSLENNHLKKIKVYIDKKGQKPIGAIVYDINGVESLRILYSDFKEIEDVESLFS